MSHTAFFTSRAEGARRIRRFNRGAALLSLLFLASAVWWSMSYRHKYNDFGQYYMGGLIAWHGAWDSLYPMPRPEALDNAGYVIASEMRLKYRELAEREGVGNTNRFIQPPPMALLLTPLAWFSYPVAHWVWVALMTLVCWRLGRFAGWTYEAFLGAPSRVAGLLVFVIAVSPLAYRTLRLGQISPLVALCFAVALRSIGQRRNVAGAGAIVLGATAKLAPLLLLPPVLLMRRWRLLGWVLILAAVLGAATLFAGGWSPFEVFLTEIGPTFDRPAHIVHNQSLFGFVSRAGGWTDLPEPVIRTLRRLSYGVLLLILWFIWWRRGDLAMDARRLFAAGGALLCWLLVFAPFSWEHHFLLTCPLWGWLWYEAEQSGPGAKVLMLAALASWWFPVAVVPGVDLPEPLASHMLWPAIGLGIFSVRRLVRAPKPMAQPALS